MKIVVRTVWMMLFLLWGGQSVCPALAQEGTEVRPSEVKSSTSPSPPRILTDRDLEERTRAIASHLRCPVCQGLSIDDSPSPSARDMRSVVKKMVAEGKSEAEIRAWFESRYGEFVLLEPKAEGMNLLVFAGPLAGVVLGVILVVALVRRKSLPSAGASRGGSNEPLQTSPSEAEGAPGTPLPGDEYAAQARRVLDEEMGR